MKSNKKKKQYTYLMKDNEYYKIGKSVDPEMRLKDLKIGNANIELICYGYNYSEHQLHIKFRKSRVSGEWFNLCPSDIAWIELNIGDDFHYLRKKVKSNINANIDYYFTKYVMKFGKYKGRCITEMVSEEQLRYCKAVYITNRKKSRLYEVFKLWYLYKTKEEDIDIRSDLSK